MKQEHHKIFIGKEKEKNHRMVHEKTKEVHKH